MIENTYIRSSDPDWRVKSEASIAVIWSALSELGLFAVHRGGEWDMPRYEITPVSDIPRLLPVSLRLSMTPLDHLGDIYMSLESTNERPLKIMLGDVSAARVSAGLIAHMWVDHVGGFLAYADRWAELVRRVFEEAGANLLYNPYLRLVDDQPVLVSRARDVSVSNWSTEAVVNYFKHVVPGVDTCVFPKLTGRICSYPAISDEDGKRWALMSRLASSSGALIRSAFPHVDWHEPEARATATPESIIEGWEKIRENHMQLKTQMNEAA